MRMTMPTTIALALLAAAATGCESQQEKDRLTLLEQENTELRTQLDERDKALDAANGELRTANASVRDWQEKYNSAEEEWTATQPADGFDGIEGVTATYGPNDVTVSVEGDVLFDSIALPPCCSLSTRAKRSSSRGTPIPTRSARAATRAITTSVLSVVGQFAIS